MLGEGRAEEQARPTVCGMGVERGKLQRHLDVLHALAQTLGVYEGVARCQALLWVPRILQGRKQTPSPSWSPHTEKEGTQVNWYVWNLPCACLSQGEQEVADDWMATVVCL